MDPLHLIVLTLATWRISSLFVFENGPWFAFERLRSSAGIYFHMHPKDGPIKIVPDTFFAQLLDCLWCFSVYAGGVLVILYFLLPVFTFYACLPFALSALAILTNLVVEKLTN